MQKSILLSFFLIPLFLVINLIYSTCVNAAPTDIAGSYKCSGNDPFAKIKYEASLVIAKTGDTYSFDWKDTNNAVYHGTGFMMNQSIVAVYSNTQNVSEMGVIAYENPQQDLLKGKWTLLNKEVIASEECKKQP